jgi:GDSL-like Lipase/Acylhydrolase family
MNKPAAQRPSSTPSKGEWFRRSVLVICAVLMALVSLEFAVRASTWGYLFVYPNFVLGARTVLAGRDQGRYVHDPQLGHVPRAGYAAPGVNIESDGLRRTGEQVAGASILAVGDSFTYGDEVNDGQTWPAQLQLLTGRRALNGGVSGYGFDQIVLRAEQLAAKYKPAVIVASFIADDIRRTEMRRLWSADKPYFVIEDGKLVLKGVPVPPRADPAGTLSFWQWSLGYSYLFDLILRRLDLLHDWYGDHKRVQAPGAGEHLACLLAGRLADLQKRSGARVIVLAEYDPVVWDDPAFAAEQRRMTRGLLDCAAREGLTTIDSFDALAATGAPKKLYVTWHMNESGNRLIAGLVAQALQHGAN